MVFSEKPKLHKRLKQGKPKDLKTIIFDVTSKCNMNCPHCYASIFKGVKPIPLEKLEGPFNELYEMGVPHFIFGGGEPIIEFERLEKVISLAHPDETYLNVLSNGWGMGLDTLYKLRDSGVDKICFSLDSGIEEEHDKYRKKGSFRKVLKAVDNIQKDKKLEGMFASITAVPTHENIYSKGFQKLINYSKETGARLQIDIAMPVGKWDGKKEILLTEKDIKYLKKLSLNNIHASDGHPLIKRDLYHKDGDRCRAGREVMYITVDGKLTPCNFLQFSLGDITKKSIKKMRDDLLKNEWFNGKQSKCLCGENREFIDKFIVPYINEPKPLDAYNIFNLK
jgi:MoaA/NifB/PqqE/SkfB family radical SAM enzyme